MTALSVPQPLRLAAGAFCLALSLSGCTVITVAGTAVSVTAGAVGLAADAAIGTARIVGKGVGKAANALLDDDDHSGVQVRYRVTDAPVESVIPSAPQAAEGVMKGVVASPLPPSSHHLAPWVPSELAPLP